MHVSGVRRGLRGRFGLAIGAVVVSAIVVVPLALANTATPTTSKATWAYVNGSSGPIEVVVSGHWTWPSQTCASGNSLSTTNIKGHYAVGFAGSWNDSTTPYTLSGKAVDGTQVTLHVGSKMDQAIANFCKNATASSPYPAGDYSVKHRYSSLAAFHAAVPNGTVCVNGYDIHKSDGGKDWNPGTNGDNTLQANQYVIANFCALAKQVVGVKGVKVVHKRAKPPKPVTGAANFTG